MGLCVVFVSGVPGSGKTALIQTMVDRCFHRPPHYLRLVAGEGNGRSGGTRRGPKAPRGVAAARGLWYDPERIFEVLPEALAEIHRKDRFGSVVVEGDTDAALRHAYPYDHRIFMMPRPTSLNDIFRDPALAALELQRVLDDTSAFASEMFGLHVGNGQMDCDPSEARARLTPAQMEGFLYSPLGDELATRIQLQPAYQGMMESDLVVVNMAMGRRGRETVECLRRTRQLVNRPAREEGNGLADRGCRQLECRIGDSNGEVAPELLRALEPMGCGGK